MASDVLVSADSHVVEPDGLWVRTVDKQFRDDAPRVVPDDQTGVPFFVGAGVKPYRVGAAATAGLSPEEAARQGENGYEGMRLSAWDPDARLKDMDVDGVYAEVEYPTLGRMLYQIEDLELQEACLRAYNSWLAEFCGAHPSRLVGIGMVSLEDVPHSVKELERCADIGLRGIAIWSSAPDDRPYSDSSYDPFWAAASERKIPLSLHSNTGKAKSRVGDMRPDVMARLGPLAIHEVQRTIVEFVMGGVLARFPQLQVTSVENDIGWIPNVIKRLDSHYDRFKGISTYEMPPERPSVYMARQVYATFEDDPSGVLTYGLFGEDNYMWASDFPHPVSTWPHSKKCVDNGFQGIPDTVRANIIGRNAARLYHIDLPSS